MSRRNDYDYFDLDNFDDSIDSREYRRRQQETKEEPETELLSLRAHW